MPTTSINVAEWSVDQVADWLSGLGPTVARYVPALRERGLDGAKLLTLRCDDLEYLGVHVIGHQELLLEAVEHLRNFQFELSRECVQQLALRVSVVATSLLRALQAQRDARLHTQTLADVARTVHAVKPLVCWLDRWSVCGSFLSERKAALLKQSLEAATCGQRDRFAEQPARAVAAAAAATAATADYIIQDVSDPMILQPASLDTVTLRQGGKPLGFDVVPSFCGHHQLADIRFGSPAHASGAVHNGDEIVQVGSQCVIGWSGAGVLRQCSAAGPELTLRLRRRAAATLGPALRPALAARRLLRPAPPPPAPAPAPSSSDESEALSPPASPTQLQPDHTRIYPPKPRAVVQRRHTISGDSSLYKRPSHAIEQFWQELKQQRWGREGGSISMSPAPDDTALYARDKAVSCSTGLELSPRPRTCLGVVLDRARPAPPPAPPGPGLAPSGLGLAPSGPPPTDEPSPSDRNRGKLDKSHSTPAYDFDASLDEPGPLAAQTIPESPTTPTDSPLALHSTDKADRILDFKKSSSQIGEAIQRGRRSNADERSLPTEPEPHGEDDMFAGERDETATERILETINIAMMEHRRRTERPEPDCDTYRSQAAPRPAPPPRPGGLGALGAGARPSGGRAPPQFPVLRAVPRPEEPPTSPLKPVRPVDATHISVPLRHITKHDIRVIPSERHEMPAINSPVSEPVSSPGAGPAGSLRRRSPGPPAAGPAGSLRRRSPGPPAAGAGDIVMGAHVSTDSSGKGHALSPTSAVRGIFPNSKSRSLKKKSSILAKRRCVPARALAQRAAAGAVWQRVRPGGAGGAGGGGAGGAGAPPVRWARRQLVLAHNLLYCYRSMQCTKAACMVYLEGFTVSAAPEVKSRAHAFKVYHTGTAFYFASDTRDAQLAWIQLIHRATLLPSLAANMDLSKQFSETDYSETESDAESPQNEPRERDKDKDKSKFGSLKKLTHRMQRADPDAPHSSTSLDRKYLRFFYRNKPKDDAKPKNKQSGVPVPTEHYRSYRRVASPTASAASASGSGLDGVGEAAPAAPRLPKPINYIHASNPNLLDFDNSDFVTKPTLHVPKPKAKGDGVGLVTLEQFMLDKQAEERRARYSGRVLLGVEHARGRDLRARLQHVVPDVIYGELGAADGGARTSARDSHGYEKIVYRDEATSSSSAHGAPAASPPPAGPAPPTPGGPGQGSGPGPGPAAGARRGPAGERWRDSLRRNDKVHWSRAEPKPAPLDRRYPHLQCPPTFQPETYSLLRPPHH